MSHTPTPWYSGGPMDFNNYIVQTNKGAIAHIHPPHAKADAEFIVRACNSHEELLAACEMAFGIIGESEVGVEAENETLDALEAAITNAKGR